jgi:hypothetical protein
MTPDLPPSSPGDLQEKTRTMPHRPTPEHLSVAVAVAAACRAGVVFDVASLLADRRVAAEAVLGGVIDLLGLVLDDHPDPDGLLERLGLGAALDALDATP